MSTVGCVEESVICDYSCGRSSDAGKGQSVEAAASFEAGE